MFNSRRTTFLRHQKINVGCEFAASNLFYQMAVFIRYFNLITVTAEKPGFHLTCCCKWYMNTGSFTAYERIFRLLINPE